VHQTDKIISQPLTTACITA